MASRTLRLRGTTLYTLFGVLISIGATIALYHQLIEDAEYSNVSDLFIGMDCDSRLSATFEPDHFGDGRDAIQLSVLGKDLKSGPGMNNLVLDSSCSRLVLFSTQEFELTDGIENTSVREIELTPELPRSPKEFLYFYIVDPRTSDFAGGFGTFVFSVPQWTHQSDEIKAIRLYLHPKGVAGTLFDDPNVVKFLEEIKQSKADGLGNVRRHPMDFYVPIDGDHQIDRSYPVVSGISTVRHAGRLKSRADFDALVPVDREVESIVVAVKDLKAKQASDLSLALISTLLGIGLAIVAEGIGRWLKGKE